MLGSIDCSGLAVFAWGIWGASISLRHHRSTRRISHEALAAIVGASRQQVTEYLNHFDREKIIFREGRRIIINTEKLGQILSGLV